jgi:hypothetical protein
VGELGNHGGFGVVVGGFGVVVGGFGVVVGGFGVGGFVVVVGGFVVVIGGFVASIFIISAVARSTTHSFAWQHTALSSDFNTRGCEDRASTADPESQRGALRGGARCPSKKATTNTIQLHRSTSACDDDSAHKAL